MRIGLLPCGSKKRDYPCPAKDMYWSHAFRSAARYVMASCDDWLVLTTKYGPVFPEQIIEPYDDYLGFKPRKEWRRWFDWIYPEPFLSMLKRKYTGGEISVWSALSIPFALYLHPAIQDAGMILDSSSLTGLNRYGRAARMTELLAKTAPFTPSLGLVK